jgi:hypothetical protein
MFWQGLSATALDWRVRRRTIVRAGAAGLAGAAVPGWLAAGERGAGGSFGRARRCVLLFLHGGPPQHETWDPKPDAPAQVRGELGSIRTRIPGVAFGELFPQVAGLADKLLVMRSVTHQDTVHTSAGYTLLTGAYHGRPNQPPAALPGPTPDDHPHLGCILATTRRAERGLPTTVAVPEVIKDAGVNTYPGQGPGLLSDRYAPLLVAANAERTRLEPPQLLGAAELAGGWSARGELLQALGGGLPAEEGAARLADYEGFRRQALELLESPVAREAFCWEREPAAVRAAYGEHLFGQGCLLARRLLEAGVLLVTVYWHYEGPEDSPAWDTHWNNFQHLRQRLAPPTDRALAALLVDLDQRGLLDDTLVVCLGEFGRTPKVNDKAGRDHWPQVQSILLAGAGLPAGAVYGASDAQGGAPADRPVAPPDLAATLLHLLGVPRALEFHDRQGRPHRAYQGTPLAELVG